MLNCNHNFVDHHDRLLLVDAESLSSSHFSPLLSSLSSPDTLTEASAICTSTANKPTSGMHKEPREPLAELPRCFTSASQQYVGDIKLCCEMPIQMTQRQQMLNVIKVTHRLGGSEIFTSTRAKKKRFTVI